MKRRKFLKNTCLGTAGCLIGSGFLGACGTAAYYAEHQRIDDRLAVPKTAFQFFTKKGEARERFYVLVKPAGAAYPIALYRAPEGYTACLLRCTHQACEVEVQGSRYACPCHGSEFDVYGAVLNGPAELPLQRFNTTEDDQYIYILPA